ncbi:MAG TPA: hypothetical protein VIL54_01445, partial [Natronosporangium sp.]
MHLVALLAPDADVHYLADALLAPLAPRLLNYQLRVRGFTVERIKAGLDQLVDRLLQARPATTS